MTGIQLVDAMYVLKASRSVLAKHIALRRRQLDIYNKTSSLVKAVRSQSHRFPLTVNAASSLADRLKTPPGPDQSLQGRAPAHVYGKSRAKLATEPVSGEDLDTRKGKGFQQSLSDQSTSSTNSKNTSPSRGRDTYSERSHVQPQNNPLADVEGKFDNSLQPISASRTSIPEPASHESLTEADRARKLQRLAEADADCFFQSSDRFSLLYLINFLITKLFEIRY